MNLSFFSVSTALQQKNEVILGAVYDPMTNELFFAQKEKGAFLWGKPIQVSKKQDPIECVFASDLSYNSKLAMHNVEKMRDLMPFVPTQRMLGSASLALTYVSCGCFDGFFHFDLYPWILLPDFFW